jgi:hypothetical protein
MAESGMVISPDSNALCLFGVVQFAVNNFLHGLFLSAGVLPPRLGLFVYP